MEFTLMDLNHSVSDIERLAGYSLLGSEYNEFRLVRKINKGDYPRFHLLVKIINGGDRGHHFTLSVERSSGLHNAIDKGSLVEKELKRIKASLTKIEN